MLPAAVARSSFDDSTTCYVLSVLFSHNGANGPKSGTALCFVQFAGWRHSGRSLLSATAYWFKLYLKYNSSADKYKQCHQIASVTLQLRRLRLLVCATASSVILSTPRADAWVGFSSLFVCCFPGDISKYDATTIIILDIQNVLRWVLETHLFWVKRSYVKVTTSVCVCLQTECLYFRRCCVRMLRWVFPASDMLQRCVYKTVHVAEQKVNCRKYSCWHAICLRYYWPA